MDPRSRVGESNKSAAMFLPDGEVKTAARGRAISDIEINPTKWSFCMYPISTISKPTRELTNEASMYPSSGSRVYAATYPCSFADVVLFNALMNTWKGIPYVAPISESVDNGARSPESDQRLSALNTFPHESMVRVPNGMSPLG